MTVEKAVEKAIEGAGAADEPADPLLTDKQVSKLATISTGTLRWWRHQGGEGPKFFNLGPRAIRYKKSDVLAWIERNYNKDGDAR